MAKKEDRAPRAAGSCTHVEYVEPVFCETGVKYRQRSEGELFAAFVPYNVGDPNTVKYLERWPERDPEGARKALETFSAAFDDASNVVSIPARHFRIMEVSMERTCGSVLLLTMAAQPSKLSISLTVPLAMMLISYVAKFLKESGIDLREGH